MTRHDDYCVQTHKPKEILDFILLKFKMSDNQNTEIFNEAEMINWELDRVFGMNDMMNSNAGHDSIDLLMNYLNFCQDVFEAGEIHSTLESNTHFIASL